jgi:hypothetical protein
MELAQHRPHLRDDSGRRRRGHQSREPDIRQLLRRQIGLTERVFATPLDHVGRKRTGPARIGRREDEAARKSRMATIDVERERAAERQAADRPCISMVSIRALSSRAL